MGTSLWHLLKKFSLGFSLKGGNRGLLALTFFQASAQGLALCDVQGAAPGSGLSALLSSPGENHSSPNWLFPLCTGAPGFSF